MVVELRLTRHGASLSVGRLFLRTWPPCTMRQPAGYDSPVPVYLVQWTDRRDGNVSQLGGFTTLTSAQECVARLESEGRSDLSVNQVAIHHRVADWHHDR